MIIVLKPDATKEQLDGLMELIEGMGFEYNLSEGVQRTIVGVIGDEEQLRDAPLTAMPGIESVVPILKPFNKIGRWALFSRRCFQATHQPLQLSRPGRRWSENSTICWAATESSSRHRSHGSSPS